MNKRALNRQLRKELLQLQAEQYRRGLVEEFRVFAPLCRSPDAAASGGASGGSAWLGRVSLLAAVLLPNRWRKLLAYGLALGKVMLAFSRQPR